MSSQLLRWRFTVEQYHQMVETGILTTDDRVELIEGEIVELSPVGRHRAACEERLIRLFSQQVGERAIIAAQEPVELSDAPNPSLTLCNLAQISTKPAILALKTYCF